VAGGASGDITTAGMYTAPATVPTPPQVNVTATSQRLTNRRRDGYGDDNWQAASVSVSVSPSAATMEFRPHNSRQP